MRYFHRTSVSLVDVMTQADDFFSGKLEETESGPRSRTFRGAIGTVALRVRADGGHYTLVTASTDQMAESEADKLVKRFLGTVHTRAEPTHELRGAY
jgi:hypothetical protein